MKCPYCGKVFDDVNKRGVHISESHVDDESICKKSDGRKKKKNIVKDNWIKGDYDDDE